MNKTTKFKILLLTVVFFSSHFMMAQVKVEVSGGVNFNDITFSAKNRVNTNYQGEDGNYIKVALSFPLNKNFGIYTGISYLSKNYRFERTGGFYGNGGQYTKYKAKYFNLPVLLIIKPFATFFKENKFDFNLLAGPYVGYWNTLDRDGKYRIFSEGGNGKGTTNTLGASYPSRRHRDSYNFSKNENRFNRLDYGLQAGSKLSYQVTKKIGVFVEYSYLYGLSDNKKNQVRKSSRYYYTTSNVGIGLSYQF